MEILIPFFFFPLLILAFAILTNLYREHRRFHYELKPNCLLTRKPVVFLTGPRSIFYFRKYWNAYPEILAEHGYEVFTLHLPWRGPERFAKMQNYLKLQAENKKQYHFICDGYTNDELRKLFDRAQAVASVTVMEDPTTDPAAPLKQSLFLSLGYRLHAWIYRTLRLPTATDLGLHTPNATSWLLQKMQSNGEQDFLS